MSLTPMLADAPEEQKGTVTGRSLSAAGTRILKPRTLNVESPAFKAAGVHHTSLAVLRGLFVAMGLYVQLLAVCNGGMLHAAVLSAWKVQVCSVKLDCFATSVVVKAQ